MKANTVNIFGFLLSITSYSADVIKIFFSLLQPLQLHSAQSTHPFQSPHTLQSSRAPSVQSLHQSPSPSTQFYSHSSHSSSASSPNLNYHPQSESYPQRQSLPQSPSYSPANVKHEYQPQQETLNFNCQQKYYDSSSPGPLQPSPHQTAAMYTQEATVMLGQTQAT